MKCNLYYIAQEFGDAGRLVLQNEERGMVVSACGPDAGRTKYEDYELYVAEGVKQLQQLRNLRQLPVNVVLITDDRDFFMADFEKFMNTEVHRQGQEQGQPRPQEQGQPQKQEQSQPQEQPQPQPQEYNLLLIKDNCVHIEDVRRVVQLVFTRVQEMQKHMDLCLKGLGRGSSLQIVTNMVYLQFSMSMSISRINGTFIAVTKGGLEERIPYLNSNWRLRYVPETEFDRKQFQERRRRMTSSRTVVVSEITLPDIEGNPVQIYFLDQAIYQKGEIIGFCSAASRTPPTAWQKDCLGEYNTLIAAILTAHNRYKDIEETAKESLLLEILSEGEKDWQLLELRLNKMDPHRKPYNFLLLISVKQQSGVLGVMVRNRIKSMLAGASVVRIGNEYMVWVNTSHRNFLKDEEEEERLTGYLRHENLQMGISDVFMNLSEMRTAYEQAKKAVFYGRKTGREDVCFRYEDFRLYHVCELLSSVTDLNHLTDSRLLALCRSSDKGEQEIVETLKLWINYDRDVKRITEELHIHRNTIYYRLNKLKDYLGVESLDNGNILLQLMFGLKLVEYQDMMLKTES